MQSVYYFYWQSYEKTREMQKENPFFFSFPSASNFGKAKVTEKNAPQKFGFVLSLYQLNISNHLSDAYLLKIRKKMF